MRKCSLTQSELRAAGARSGIKHKTIEHRLRCGWPIEEALAKKPRAFGDRSDISGARFGHLVVQCQLPPSGKFAPKWRTLCDCGATYDITRARLRSVTTCQSLECQYRAELAKQKAARAKETLARNGTATFRPIVGMVFDQLTVVEQLHDQMVRCECSCGSKNVIRKRSRVVRAKNGIKVSCGCHRIYIPRIKDTIGLMTITACGDTTVTVFCSHCQEHTELTAKRFRALRSSILAAKIKRLGSCGCYDHATHRYEFCGAMRSATEIARSEGLGGGEGLARLLKDGMPVNDAIVRARATKNRFTNRVKPVLFGKRISVKRIAAMAGLNYSTAIARFGYGWTAEEIIAGVRGTGLTAKFANALKFVTLRGPCSATYMARETALAWTSCYSSLVALEALGLLTSSQESARGLRVFRATSTGHDRAAQLT